MTDHSMHEPHDHVHHDTCGHTKVQHEKHTDFLHDGHLHHLHDGHIDEHALPITEQNPQQCTPSHACSGHDQAHTHGPNCGHEAIPHGDHTDYLVDGHLHFAHDSHCDDHGIVKIS